MEYIHFTCETWDQTNQVLEKAKLDGWRFWAVRELTKGGAIVLTMAKQKAEGGGGE